MSRFTCALIVALTFACSPAPMMNTGGGGGSITGGGGGASGGGAGGGGGGQTGLTEAQRVAVYCEKTRTASCSQWFATQQECVDLVARTQHTLCQAKWEAETDCLGTTQPSDWMCSAFGEPVIASTRCRDQYGFGSYCRLAIANIRCFAGACRYNADCPTGFSCNDKTEHCFDSSAQCGGLPCSYNADCPTGFTCNNALEQCVRQ